MSSTAEYSSTEQDDLRLLRDSTSRFLSNDRSFPPSSSRPDPQILRTTMAELGWFMLSVPDTLGGLGGGAAELLLINEEVGRALSTEPSVPALLVVGPVLSRFGSEALIESFMAGSRSFAYATLDRRRPSLRLLKDHGDHALLGETSIALDADTADYLLLAVPDGDEASILCVPSDARGISRTPTRLLDGSRAARVSFDGSRLRDAQVVCDRREGAALAAEIADRAAAGAVARAFGATEAAFALTLDHIRARRQFGRALSSFQGLQHAMADAFCSIEQLRSLLREVAESLAGDQDRRAKVVSAAKAFVDSRLRSVIETCIQASGGIGVTNEYALGRYYKSVLTQAAIFGDAEYHLERIAEAARNRRSTIG